MAELAHRDGYSGNRHKEAMIDINGGMERLGPTLKRILVDKTTHRIRYENESELQVTIIIGPKEPKCY